MRKHLLRGDLLVYYMGKQVTSVIYSPQSMLWIVDLEGGERVHLTEASLDTLHPSSFMCGAILPHEWEPLPRPTPPVATFEGKPIKVLRWLSGRQEYSVQEKLEQASYLRNPLAVWERPDGDYLTDDPWRERGRWYDPQKGMTMEFEYL